MSDQLRDKIDYECLQSFCGGGQGKVCPKFEIFFFFSIFFVDLFLGTFRLLMCYRGTGCNQKGQQGRAQERVCDSPATWSSGGRGKETDR